MPAVSPLVRNAVKCRNRRTLRSGIRCFGSPSPIARSASPVAAEAEFGGEAGGEKSCCGRGARQDAPSVSASDRSLYPVIERSLSGPLLVRQDLLPCVFGIGDASRRVHSVVAHGARGPGLAPAVATRVRLRSRPGIAVNLQEPWAAGTPERNASGFSSPERSPRPPRLGRRAMLPGPRVRDAIQGLCGEESGFRWGGTGRARRGLGSGFNGSSRGVSSWRGFASVSSSSEPEPYLRYIHRVKTEDSEDDAGGSMNGGTTRSQVRALRMIAGKRLVTQLVKR